MPSYEKKSLWLDLPPFLTQMVGLNPGTETRKLGTLRIKGTLCIKRNGGVLATNLQESQRGVQRGSSPTDAGRGTGEPVEPGTESETEPVISVAGCYGKRVLWVCVQLGGPGGKRKTKARANLEDRIAELQRKVGQQTMVIVTFLQRAFKRVEALRRQGTTGGVTASMERSGQ